MSTTERLGDLLRELAPQVLGLLLRRHGGFEECEDAVQEALLVAATQWPAGDIPENPRSWLVTVASRRLVDQRGRTAPRSKRSTRPVRAQERSPSMSPTPG